MPPPPLKTLRVLHRLADLRWQAERRALVEAQRRSAEREAALDDLQAARDAELQALLEAPPDLHTAMAAMRYEGWAQGKSGRLRKDLAAALRREDAMRDRAAEEFGRVRALEHVEKRAKAESDRLRRAAQEREGLPPD